MITLLRRAVIGLCAALLSLFLATVVFGWLATDRGLSESRTATAPLTIVVLGGGQRPDFAPGPASRARLHHAVALYHAGAGSRLVITGGSDRAVSTARGMGRLARQLGVPADAIALEETSRSTIQNALNSRPLVDGPIILVTSRPHLLRSWVFFQGAGYNIAYTSAPRDRERWDFYPYELAAWAFNAVKITLWVGAGVLGWSDEERLPLLN